MTLALCATGRSESHLCDWQGQRLNHEALADFQRLQRRALADGIDLRIASAYRSFSRQAMIWNNKYLGVRPVFDASQQVVDLAALSPLERLHAIMLYSALPGASRHHFGSDFDVWDPSAVAEDYQLQLSPDEYAPSGPFATLNAWLSEHLHELGFYRPYLKYQGGVAAEPWHISHISSAETLQGWQTPASIADALIESEVAGKEEILPHLDELYARYVQTLCAPE
ncbi:M15 family metallopeptidase [Pseudoalteromonas sp. BDTF-M6]|uniref:M15 family metallopeptidase n=1 Tax=Pseudoalteromonas sp. BDTF-M6 TaxID=2796132 RepID=UPI001BAFBEC4|nr:M15 family metallopeptidase [Pseudoalteromonas sp. BDTF-M6]MBS3796930.1 M15 family metallopeptidase [Pseudoalteromonas sp. BDTF-M6]